MFPLSNPLDMDISSVDGAIDYLESEIYDTLNLIHFLENNKVLQLEKIETLKNQKLKLNAKRHELFLLFLKEELKMERQSSCHSVP